MILLGFFLFRRILWRNYVYFRLRCWLRKFCLVFYNLNLFLLFGRFCGFDTWGRRRLIVFVRGLWLFWRIIGCDGRSPTSADTVFFLPVDTIQFIISDYLRYFSAPWDGSLSLSLFAHFLFIQLLLQPVTDYEIFQNLHIQNVTVLIRQLFQYKL